MDTVARGSCTDMVARGSGMAEHAVVRNSAGCGFARRPGWVSTAALAVVPLALGVLVMTATALLGAPSRQTATDQVAVLANDFTTGAVVSLSGDSAWSATETSTLTCGDAVGRYSGGLLYVVNRLGCDNIEVVDPTSNWAIVREFSVGPGTNPQDIAVVDSARAYVSRYETNWLLEVDPHTGAKLDSVSLAALADSADGLCEMHRMLLHGGYLYVEVQRMDRQGFLWTPVPPSYLAVVDLGTRTLVDVDPGADGVQGIRLAGTNPDAPIQVDPATGELLVPEAGTNGVIDAGGIERVDPVAWRSEGFMVTEEALAGDLVDFTLYSDTLGFAVVSRTGYNTVLVSFDPSTGEVKRELYNPGGYALFDCLARPSGVLLVADRGDSAGVRLFDAVSGSRMGTPISTGLPPFELVLMDTPAPAPEPVTWLAPPYPNPTAGEVHVRWEGPAVPQYLEVYDAAGRLVRRLDWFETAPPSSSWDGRDRNGNRVGAGVYRLRAAGAGDAPARAVCILH